MRWYRLYCIVLYCIISLQKSFKIARKSSWVPQERPSFKGRLWNVQAVPNPGDDSLRLATCGYGQDTVDLWPIEAWMARELMNSGYPGGIIWLFSWCNLGKPRINPSFREDGYHPFIVGFLGWSIIGFTMGTMKCGIEKNASCQCVIV